MNPCFKGFSTFLRLKKRIPGARRGPEIHYVSALILMPFCYWFKSFGIRSDYAANSIPIASKYTNPEIVAVNPKVPIASRYHSILFSKCFFIRNRQSRIPMILIIGGIDETDGFSLPF